MLYPIPTLIQAERHKTSRELADIDAAIGRQSQAIMVPLRAAVAFCSKMIRVVRRPENAKLAATASASGRCDASGRSIALGVRR